MAVAFDAATESVRTDTTDPWTFSHTPSGTPRGVVLLVTQNVSNTDHIVTATYGGVAMRRIQTNLDAAGEPGRSYIYFLGSGVPTGVQTVSVDLATGTTDDMHFVCNTVTAGADVVVIDNDGLSAHTTNPSATHQYFGRTCISFAVLFSGLDAPSSITAAASCTIIHDHDYTSQSSSTVRQTTPGTANFTVGFTATADDTAFSSICVAERQAIDIDVSTKSKRVTTGDPWTFTHTPGGTPKGVVLLICHVGSTTDFISGVTYGGVALTRVIRRTDAAAEPGDSDIWFLGSSIPTGAQTVSIDLSSDTAEDFLFTCVTLLADDNTAVVDSDGINDDAANPSVTLNYGGAFCQSLAVLYSGLPNETDITPNSNCGTLQSDDFGANVYMVIAQGIGGTSDFAIGVTAALDDCAYTAVAIGLAVAAVSFVPQLRRTQKALLVRR